MSSQNMLRDLFIRCLLVRTKFGQPFKKQLKKTHVYGLTIEAYPLSCFSQHLVLVKPEKTHSIC